DYYSQVRTEAAIRRADVILFLLDASQEVTRTDKRLGEFIATEGRICVLVANKWDLSLGEGATSAYAEYLYDPLRGPRHARVVFTPASDSKNIQATVDLTQSLFKKALRRVGTGELNRVLKAVSERQSPRARGGKVPRIYYGTQVGTAPPTFVLFVNE